ncbi:hypothetical protein PORCRE_151 [Porphyromonas crevioricanis JCM 15906]|uniref:Uncharacterized protein n=1 Tax=Porphyromonas crevioricanis JCM 15906 TaxID=1305617 RepID=S4NFV7_9PORP|nr:hypothetical protein PORCRE_151 [Porphyromonas crevioricanis JCM 15906]
MRSNVVETLCLKTKKTWLKSTNAVIDRFALILLSFDTALRLD